VCLCFHRFQQQQPLNALLLLPLNLFFSFLFDACVGATRSLSNWQLFFRFSIAFPSQLLTPREHSASGEAAFSWKWKWKWQRNGMASNRKSELSPAESSPRNAHGVCLYSWQVKIALHIFRHRQQECSTAHAPTAAGKRLVKLINLSSCSLKLGST